MIRFLLLCLVLCASVCRCPAQDEGKALPPFQKAFHFGKKEHPAPVAERRSALQTLHGLDSPKVAEALAEAWRNVDAEAGAMDAERLAAAQEMAEIAKGQEANERRTFPSDKHQRFQALEQRLQQLRKQGEELRELQTAVGDELAAARRKDTQLFLLQKVVADKRDPLPLRLCAARALGAGAGEILPELAAALPRAREIEEAIALLDAFAAAGQAARAYATPVIALLQHKEEAVRERAALALARIAVPAAIEPLLALLPKSAGQHRQRLIGALETLTGQQHGNNLGAWQAWWQAEGADYKSGARPLGAGKPSRAAAADQRYYFGIPQDQSAAIVYLLDCSGSMAKEVDFKPPGGTAAGAHAGKSSRLDACKRELIKALGQLRPEQRFGLLWYNDLPNWWQPQLQPATKEAVAAAQAFVATLQPASSTNIHDSLERAFALAGRGAQDRYYGSGLDTIFLLTDGTPTLPGGGLDSTDKILVAVRRWNPLHRVTIHTIGIGGELNEGFLSALAQENGGEFRKY